MASDNILEIKCPKCAKRHRYALEIQRSMILYHKKVDTYRAPATERSFTRLFTCPVKEEEFQAVIIITETSHNKIESVEVKGIAKEQQDDDNEN